MNERFWMLFVEGGAAPNYKHLTPDAAHTEAERLAKLTQKRVYVLTAVSACEVKAVDWTSLGNPAEIPF